MRAAMRRRRRSSTTYSMRPRSLRRLTTTATLLATGAVVVACGGGGGGADDDRTDVIPAQDCVFQYSGEPPLLLAGADPLRPQQWHLEALGAISVWDSLGIKGEGVRVAVVDDAVETLHEDLFPNVGTAHNYRRGGAPGSAPLPCESDDQHGTSVAGIVAARDGNGVGVAGIAPRATLAAYNALATSTTADIADALRRDGNANAIFNNSWGSPDNGVLHKVDSSFINAIEDGIRNGRNGLGSVYVFAAGNRFPVSDDNSNFDGFVNHRGVIAVCPVDDADQAPPHAEPGANILVCGFSGGGSAGITTTAVRNGYRHDFSGTSASTPMVSGVVALMLSANPSLTWRDVRIILARSARRNSPGDPDWRTNAAGLSVHPSFGFGVADANAAVRMAQGWSSVGGSESLKSCSYVRNAGNAGLPIGVPPDGTPISDIVEVGAECKISQIEFVDVFFTATHTYSGDLRVELLRPDTPTAPVAVLANERLCNTDGDEFADNCGSYLDWRFGSVQNLGETAAGRWQLRVSDREQVYEDEGEWDSWRLVLWGR